MYCDTNTHVQNNRKMWKNDECEGGWCCDDKTPTYQCVYKGTKISSGGKSWLCDPPEGFVNSSNEEINTNNQANKKLTLLDLLINPFSYFSKSRIQSLNLIQEKVVYLLTNLFLH